LIVRGPAGRAVPLRECEAFVLQSRPLGEADRIVTFLTRTAGKLRGVAKGARRSRRRFGSSLELLSRVRVTYFERERSDLVRIDGADLLESFYRLQEDPVRGAVLACCAEIADAFTREAQEDEAFFRLLHAVLRAVGGGLHLDWAARYFELWTLRLHGVLPPLDSCSGCAVDLRSSGGRYDRRSAGLLCGRCRPASGLSVPPAALQAARAIFTLAPAALSGRPASPAALNPLAALAEGIFLEVTERRFKSYEVLKQIRG
jgi:DNA repair protein RecO (recombination protein O)